MRKRDRLRAIFTSVPPTQRTSSTQAPPLSSPPFQPASSTALPAASTSAQTLPSSSQSCSPSSSMASLVVTTPRRMILEKALAKTLEEIPDVEKAAFTQASMTIDETRLLSSVQDYDA